MSCQIPATKLEKMDSTKICRTCLSIIEGANYIHLNGSENSFEKEVMNMLSVYVPEMEVNRVVDPVMCHACFTVLCSYHEFRKICRETEEKINNGQFVNVVPGSEDGYSVYIKEEADVQENVEVKDENSSECETYVVEPHAVFQVKQEVEEPTEMVETLNGLPKMSGAIDLPAKDLVYPSDPSQPFVNL